MNNGTNPALLSRW